MAKLKWDADCIPDQKTKVIVITGATSGLGKEVAKVLAGKNATVVMAVRNISKGEQVANGIKTAFPYADIYVQKLDLSDLASVKHFAESFSSEFPRLDVLINNAGIMFCPESKTADGFELQMGTNHLGHFALVGLLMPLLEATKGSRLVVTSSAGHKPGNIELSDLNWEQRKYSPTQAYYDSKLANLYFAYELVRRTTTNPDAPRITAAHPGWTRTELQRHSVLMDFLNKFFSQVVDMGVLPTLRGAFDDNAAAGDYYGPADFFEMRGHPVLVKSSKRSYDQQIAAKLWTISEELTGISY